MLLYLWQNPACRWPGDSVGRGPRVSSVILPTDACEIGAEALHGDDDAAFLFEPLPDACQALPIGNGSSDLGPKSANLAGFCRGLFPAPLREAEAGPSDPLLLGLCVFFALCHTVYDAFDIFPQDSTVSRSFDKIQRFSTTDSTFDWPADRFRDPKRR
jgi:hypothetical protein